LKSDIHLHHTQNFDSCPKDRGVSNHDKGRSGIKLLKPVGYMLHQQI